MIYEYALNPALVVDWAIAKIGRYVRQFGMDQRRLVSDFPDNWESLVYGAFYQHFDYKDDSEEFQKAQLDLTAYLQILTDYMVYRKVKISGDTNWLDAAVKEHSYRPFYAIFTSKTDDLSSLGEVITEENLDDIRDIRWWLPTVKPTRKSASEIAVFLRPLLKACSEIHIVDPYFDFDPNRPRFEKTLVEIVNQAIMLPRAVQCIPSITIITGVERNNRNHQTTDQEAKNFAHNIQKRAKENLSKQIENFDIKIQLIVLKNIPKCDPLHNRCVLTNIGGVIFPFGTDDYDREHNHSATDDLMLMPKGIYEARWKRFVKKLKKEELVLGPVSI